MKRGISYSPGSSRTAWRRLALLSALVLLILAIDMVSGGMLRRGVRAVGARVWGGVSGVSAAISHTGYFSSHDALEAQIQSLSQQLTQYQDRAAAYSVLLSQYNALAKLTHIAKTVKGISAPIVSSLSASPYGTFSVGAGTADGVANGDLVLSGAGFVIGHITDAGTHTSLVSELFAPGATLDVAVDGAHTRAAGSGGENASAQVPRGVQVATGDPVFAPSLNDRPVGIVGYVSSSSASAYENLIISLPINLTSSQYVYIVTQF